MAAVRLRAVGVVFPTWSAQINTTRWVDISGAQVIVTVDGEPRAVNDLARLDGGFGARGPVLSWTVPITDADRQANRTINVTLSNVLVRGEPHQYSLEMRAFQADQPPSPPVPPAPQTSPAPVDPPPVSAGRPPAQPVFLGRARIRRASGGRLVVVATAGGASRLSYQWLRDRRPIRRATGRYYRPTSADRDRNLSCRVTAVAQSLHGTSSATSTSGTFHVPPAKGKRTRLYAYFQW